MAMNIDEFYASEFAEHRNVAEKTAAACKEPFAELLRECVTCVEHGGKILFFEMVEVLPIASIWRQN